MVDAFKPALKRHYRTADALRNKWVTLRVHIKIAIKNYEASGQGENDMFPDFANGEPIVAYNFCVFKDLLSLNPIIREMTEENKAECDVGNISVSERTSGRRTPRHGAKREGITYEGLKTIADSIAKPIEVKFTVSQRDETST